MKMNTAQFMDKQIMDLSASGSGKPAAAAAGEEFLLDLVNSHLRQAAAGETDADAVPPPPPRFGYGENNQSSSGGGYEGGGERVEEVEEEEEEEEEIVPSYDFHPIRPLDSPAPRVWASADSKSSPSFPKSYGSFDPAEKVKVTAGSSIDMAGIVSEVDHAMKMHTDNLLHALEGISARLTQLETRTRGLESSVDDLKVSVGNNYGSTDGKMRQLENILREVQAGVHVIKDKQETMETQLQLAKMHVSKSDQPQPPPESQNTMNMDATVQAASAPPQSHQQLHPPVPFLHAVPPGPLPPPLTSPAALHNLPPSGPHPSQFPQNQIPPMPQRDSYYPPPGQTQEAPSQQYHQVPSSQPPHPPPTALPHPSHAPPTQHSAAAAPHQAYPPAPPQSLYSHQSLPPQPQPSQGHHHEEAPYPPAQSFPPNVHHPASQPPGGAPPPSQQFYGAPPSVYEAPSSRPGSSFPASYGAQPSGPTEPYPYGGSASQYGGRPAVKQQQFSTPPVAQGGGGGYPQLPTARILPQALPTASGIDGGGSSPTGTGNRVPLDDVVDRVTNMGFSRELVRATVRRLTENGQSVDLNIVLDKLMNEGEGPTQRGWYGR